MIDIHSHILYGVDDGADTLFETLEMAEIACENGTRVIAVTPHCNLSDDKRNFWNEGLKDRFLEVKDAVKKAGLPLQLLPGQEIFGKGEIVKHLKTGELITLNGSRYPLIEFPFNERSENVFKKLQAVIAEGFVPVVAHPERYGFVSENFDSLLKLKKMGCLLQVNTGSIDGVFGHTAKNMAIKMLNHHTVDVVASDAHSPFMRSPNLGDAHEYLCENYSTEFAERLLLKNPRAILENKTI
ncbi:MAG: hypothetical protein IJ025_02135 [Clostridia bacterium]|nr:hypothetical protein [Clostridia bacterium]